MDASSSRNTRGKVRQFVEPGPQEVLLYAYLGMCCECSNTVDAILYACRVCPNFEWCEACAQKTDHPIDHPFLRVNLHGEGNNQAEIETEEAQQLWKLCEQASPSKDAIPFLLFVDQLSKFLKIDLTQGDVAALEAILGDISTQDEISVNSLEIKPSEFALFVKRFGPIHLSLKKIQQVLMDGSKWFHGNMDLPKATAIFKGQPNKSFLIRYSSRTPGAFSINYIKDGEMKIFNRISNNVEGEGLFVHSEKQKLQYSSFASFIKSNSHIFTYPVDDPLPSFLRIKKQKLLDMGVSAATPYTFNFSRNNNSNNNTAPLNTSLTAEDFYDALARKADGFSNQMMATSPPGSSSRNLNRPKEAPRRVKSANNTPTKPRGMSNSGNAIQGKYNKHNVDTQGIEEAPESKALRALLLEARQKSPPPHQQHPQQHLQQLQQPQQPQHHRSRSGNAPASPKKKKDSSMFKAGAHYTSFYSDDEEDLPDIVAGI